MMPVFSSFSENNNVHFMINIMGRSAEGENYYVYDNEPFPTYMCDISKEKFRLLEQDSEFFYQWGYNPGEIDDENEDNNDVIIDASDGNESGQICRPNLSARTNLSYSDLVELITTTSYSDGRPQLKFLKSGDYIGEDNEIYCITKDNKIVLNSHHIEVILGKI